MDILDELVEKFAITLDSQLCNNSEYLKAMALLNELVREFQIKRQLRLRILQLISQQLLSVQGYAPD
ncbi:hypothetical protein [Ruminococcus sp.]|uniref:hypothetical protein n=1 Tax=Ruminococcus sp. TaxID=41978 RepID=UPI002BC717E1|nr:hypothetical protein [Ruminococcus sp.]HOA00627.1 hypothetical protein [Ruminococcus sp.]HOH87922.1 hypothetical protein [Ruminococcus sp.]